MRLIKKMERAGLIDLDNASLDQEDIEGDIAIADPSKIKALTVPKDTILWEILRPWAKIGDTVNITKNRDFKESVPKHCRMSTYSLDAFLELVDILKAAAMELKEIGECTEDIRIILGTDWPIQIELLGSESEKPHLILQLAPRVKNY